VFWIPVSLATASAASLPSVFTLHGIHTKVVLKFHLQNVWQTCCNSKMSGWSKSNTVVFELHTGSLYTIETTLVEGYTQLSCLKVKIKLIKVHGHLKDFYIWKKYTEHQSKHHRPICKHCCAIWIVYKYLCTQPTKGVWRCKCLGEGHRSGCCRGEWTWSNVVKYRLWKGCGGVTIDCIQDFLVFVAYRMVCLQSECKSSLEGGLLYCFLTTLSFAAQLHG
jgi:hypothetical protein